MGAVAGGATRSPRRIEKPPSAPAATPEAEALATPPPLSEPDPGEVARRAEARAAAARADREAQAARRRVYSDGSGCLSD